MKHILRLKPTVSVIIFVVTLNATLNAHAAIPHFFSNGMDNADSWHLTGGLAPDEVNGVGVAQFSLWRSPSGSDIDERHITVATSLAIPPLLGMSLSKLITRHSSTFENSFWPNLLGAYAGAGVSMGSLALLHHAGSADAPDDGQRRFDGNGAENMEAAILSTFFQVLLPMALPGLGAAAGYALGKAPKPVDTDVSFLSPTLFRSPSPSRNRKYILGVQLISARF